MGFIDSLQLWASLRALPFARRPDRPATLVEQQVYRSSLLFPLFILESASFVRLIVCKLSFSLADPSRASKQQAGATVWPVAFSPFGPARCRERVLDLFSLSSNPRAWPLDKRSQPDRQA